MSVQQHSNSDFTRQAGNQDSIELSLGCGLLAEYKKVLETLVQSREMKDEVQMTNERYLLLITAFPFGLV
jgi:hypothetical protein